MAGLSQERVREQSKRMVDGFSDLDRLPIERKDGQVVLVDRYRLAHELARTPLEATYMAEDLTLDNSKVVVKVPSSILADDPTTQAALKQEALAAMGLSHRNIVALRAYKQTDRGIFMVFSHIEGRTLEEVLADSGPLAERIVMAIFKPIAEALDYAHPRGVVHRDIKPKNIIIGANGQPFITGFGVACRLKLAYARLTSKITADALPYLSPEQLTGKPPTPAQDVYGLAATIYTCLAGKPPFWRGNVREQIINATPTPPIEQETALSRAVLRALGKDPAGRPRTCVELLITATAPQPAAPVVKTPAPARNDQNDVPMPGPIQPELCQPGSVITNSLGMKLAYVPAGKFRMGSREREDGRSNDEKRHMITLTKGFFVGVTPVTRAQFAWFATATDYKPLGILGRMLKRNTWDRPGFEQSDEHPVIWVNWHAAAKFCTWLSEKENRRYRLPTEAQWEYACRAGSVGPFAGTGKLKEMGWYSENSLGRTHSVGQKKPNAWGLYDMHGNVWEWCHDWYAPNIGDAPATDPAGIAGGAFRVLRGGAWYLIDRFCRSACRPRFKPEFSSALTGMRVVLRVE